MPSLLAAAASRSDQPIAFGSAVIVSELSVRRLAEVVQGEGVKSRSHELSHKLSHDVKPKGNRNVSHDESQA